MVFFFFCTLRVLSVFITIVHLLEKSFKIFRSIPILLKNNIYLKRATHTICFLQKCVKRVWKTYREHCPPPRSLYEILVRWYINCLIVLRFDTYQIVFTQYINIVPLARCCGTNTNTSDTLNIYLLRGSLQEGFWNEIAHRFLFSLFVGK